MRKIIAATALIAISIATFGCAASKKEHQGAYKNRVRHENNGPANGAM